MKNRIINTLLAFVLCMQLIPQLPAFAADFGETKTELMNVALFKPVTVSVDSLAHGQNSNLNDDHNNTDIVLSYGNKAQWMMIDLQRRYKIDHIDIGSRSTSGDSVWLSDFEIQASNNKDFPENEYTVLDSCLSSEGEALPAFGKENMTFNGSGTESYRYVRIYATHMMGVSEMRVYAEQTVTEVKPVSAVAGTVWNDVSTLSGAMAIDGNTGTTWVGAYTANRDFLRVDMGDKYNIGYIELYGRMGTSDEAVARSYFNIYGINDLSDADDSAVLESTDLSEYNYTLLSYLKNPAGEHSFNYNPFPKDGKYSVTVNDETAFRYFTFKKTNTEHSQLSEFKTYVVNPVVNRVLIDGDILTIEFSDEMDTGSLSDIYFEDKETGETYAVNGTAEDLYTYAIDISGFDRECAYTLYVSPAKNLKNVNAKGDISFSSLEDYMVSGFGFYDESGNSVESVFDTDVLGVSAEISNIGKETRSAMAAVGIYENGSLIGVNVSSAVTAPGESADLKTFINIPAELYPGRKYKGFLWETTNQNIKPMKNSLLLIEYDRYDIYVSDEALSGGNGTEARPFNTLLDAQTAVRELNTDMTRDINVYIEPGVYELNEVWMFDETDSGMNGYRVNYKALGDVEVSGGERIDNWENVSGNLYKAPYSGESLVSELYASGVKAKRAGFDSPIQPKGFYLNEAEEPEGVLVDISYLNLKNPEDMQLKYNRGWKTFVINAEDIVKTDEETAAIMLGDEFKKATGTGAHGVKDYNSFYLLNVYEELDEPGEYYYDRNEGCIYYMTDGTDISDISVYVPVLEQLICISGSDLSHKAENITFDGIRFAHAAWNYPAEHGYIGGQAQGFSGAAMETALDELGKTTVDAGVQIRAAEGIEFINGEFTGIAKVGVGLYNGAVNNRIEGNAFYSLGDSAVTIGLPSDNYMELEYEGYNLAFNKVCTDNVSTSGHPAYLATDGNAKSGWNCASADGDFSANWWQVDLGAEYEIDRIEIDARSDYDQETTRRYFEVLASNDPEFKEGVVTLASTTTEEFGHTETWRKDVTETGKYRYVRVRKTIDEYFFLAEIRVINLSMEHVLHKEVCADNKIYNNYITEIGKFNHGAPGIQAYYTDSVDIANNEVVNVPYSGIAFGWGWTTYLDSVTAKNNKIRNNVIDNFGLINMDGGGIYSLGMQPGTVVSGNYIKGQNSVYGAIYPDSGSDSYTVKENVVEDVWLSFFVSTNEKKNLVFEDNWSTTKVKEMWGENCTETNTQYFVPGDMPETAQAIADNAGLAPGYENIRAKVKVMPHEYTTEEIWHNTLGEISGSLTDNKLLQYALRNIIRGAETIRDTADTEKYPSEAFEALQTAIDTANAEYTSIAEEIQTATDNGASSTSSIIDRGRIISAKAELDAAVDTFINSKINYSL